MSKIMLLHLKISYSTISISTLAKFTCIFIGLVYRTSVYYTDVQASLHCVSYCMVMARISLVITKQMRATLPQCAPRYCSARHSIAAQRCLYTDVRVCFWNLGIRFVLLF